MTTTSHNTTSHGTSSTPTGSFQTTLTGLSRATNGSGTTHSKDGTTPSKSHLSASSSFYCLRNDFGSISSFNKSFYEAWEDGADGGSVRGKDSTTTVPKMDGNIEQQEVEEREEEEGVEDDHETDGMLQMLTKLTRDDGEGGMAASIEGKYKRATDRQRATISFQIGQGYTRS